MSLIMVVDSHIGSREFARFALEPVGHRVIEAIDGEEAIRKASEIVPALVLLELRLQLLDGFATLIALRTDARLTQMPVIAYTASAMRGDRERVLAAGFSDYISKPISLGRFRAHIQHFVEHAGSATASSV